MLGCYDSVTLWHYMGGINYVSSVIDGVKFKSDNGLSVSADSKVISNSYVLIVPTEKVETEIKVGDLVALGEHDLEITGVKPYTKNDIRRTLEPYFFEVKEISDNRRLPNGGHLKIIGF